MNRRKIAKICWWIFLIVFIADLLEIGMRYTVQNVAEFAEKKEEEKEEKIIYNSEEKKTEREVEVFVKNILDAIQDKDYEYVFSLLETDYNEYMFNNSINSMQKYIVENFDNEAKYQITNIFQYGGTYHATISEEIAGIYTTKYITAVKKSQNNYSFMFGEYEYIRKKDLKYVKDDIEYNISYTYAINDVETYVIDVKNKTSETLKIIFNNIDAVSSDGRKFTCTKPTDITIKTKETTRIEIAVQNKNLTISRIQMETLKNNKEEKVIFLFETLI